MSLSADSLVPGPEGAGDDADTARRFAALQARLHRDYRAIFSDKGAPRTVIVLPSLTLDGEILAKITGVSQYEQRLLCLLFLLRYPNLRLVYLSSEPIPPAIIDYYLHLLPGIPREHAMRRLTLLSCHDAAARPLTEKVLERPRLLARIRAAVPAGEAAHLTCFNVDRPERDLALALGIPVYGCDPALLPLGSKSGSRRLFRAAGLAMAEGHEDLADLDAVAEALADLRARDPGLARAVVKLNEGFSGEGNAVFDFTGAPPDDAGGRLRRWVAGRLAAMRFVAQDMTIESFGAKLAEMGGIVEAFIEGRVKRSPSAQYRVTPLGSVETISTHDQITGGPGGQVFEGCRFPADAAYRRDVQEAGLKVARALALEGVLGRFGIDFISVRGAGGDWRHYACEINLRKGGTTHPFLMLQHLTDGRYDPEAGVYRSRSGRSLCYVATDTLSAPAYRGLIPEDLIDIAVEAGLHFNPLTQEGVAFHLIGALSAHGKLGVTCVGASPRAARAIYVRTVAALDAGTGNTG